MHFDIYKLHNITFYYGDDASLLLKLYKQFHLGRKTCKNGENNWNPTNHHWI